MRIVRLDETGPPENLKLVEVPEPEPGPGEILIRVALAGMIFGDIEARKGTYFKPTPLPFFPGREVAGEIAAVGQGVAEFRVGDRVLALVTTNRCWADYVVAPTSSVAHIAGSTTVPADIVKLPAHVSFERALPYLINFRLAHMLFHGSSQVPNGARVLIHGASGGMGSMLVELARAHECEVIATCRTDRERSYCLSLGADHVISLIDQDYVSRVSTLTSGHGVSFSFNGIGGDTLNTDFDVLAPFGELQAYGYVAGKSSFEAFRLGKTITLKTFSADNFLNTEVFGRATEAMNEWFSSENLREASTIVPLSEVVEANRLLESGAVLGKLALRP